MENAIAVSGSNEKIKSIILDIFALTAIYFMPTIAHMFSLPVYLIEPLRIILVLSIVHTNKANAYILALSMPLFSFLVSGHPVFFKMLMISGELALNVWLFFFISKRVSNKFVSMFGSIVISKLFYYVVQFIFISAALLTAEEVEHPIIPQIIVSVVLSAYFLFSDKIFPNTKKS